MDSKDESSPDNGNRYRKFGLPGWMMNNIERLNFSTDFEQYACSPPETEGFLSEHIDNSDYHDASEPHCPVVIPNDSADVQKLSLEIKKDSETKSTTGILASSVEPVTPPISFLGNMRHEDFYSSPDSTPCATPEPSPAPRRKMSGQQDTVQTNPGRWFYLGNVKRDRLVQEQCLNVNTNKQNRKKSYDKSNEGKLKESPVKPKQDGIKLVISNFDINAISPSSW